MLWNVCRHHSKKALNEPNKRKLINSKIKNELSVLQLCQIQAWRHIKYIWVLKKCGLGKCYENFCQNKYNFQKDRNRMQLRIEESAHRWISLQCCLCRRQRKEVFILQKHKQIITKFLRKVPFFFSLYITGF